MGVYRVCCWLCFLAFATGFCRVLQRVAEGFTVSWRHLLHFNSASDVTRARRTCRVRPPFSMSSRSPMHQTYSGIVQIVGKTCSSAAGKSMLTELEVIVQATGNALTKAVTAAEAEARMCTLGELWSLARSG